VTAAFDHVVAALPPAMQAALAEAADGAELHAEACWYGPDPVPELVVGLVRGAPARLVRLADRLVPAQAPRVARWLAGLHGIEHGIEDVGFKVGHHGVQLYVRGQISADAATASFTHADVPVHPPQARNLLALLAQPSLAMIGLEIEDERIEGALYASVPRVPATARAVSDAVRFLVRVVAPDQVPVWDAVAPALFDAPADEIVYVSTSATLDWAWAKLDVGMRQLPMALALAAHLETTAITTGLAAARALGGTSWSHVGMRFGSNFGPAFYLPIAGDRER